ncbi:hypothetical protein [Spirillospora sp. NPDC029432]|uniref:hypothetical protein n=1 Tax=Spirillospora sp. NPDC029432 TaxID=3154599 RepID=UPI0034525BF8
MGNKTDKAWSAYNMVYVGLAAVVGVAFLVLAMTDPSGAGTNLAYAFAAFAAGAVLFFLDRRKGTRGR